MGLLLGIIGVLVVVAAIVQGVTMWVCGPFLSEEELGAYLGEHLESATLNPYSHSILSMPDFASNSIQGPLNGWYIHDRGLVPRWSRWSAKMDEKLKELKNAI